MEMEDLAFRFWSLETYKQTARLLDSRSSAVFHERCARWKSLNQVVWRRWVQGAAQKHIYSIVKMRGKSDFDPCLTSRLRVGG
jgi:(p)ppGpp synthase/HD superfamily hydrolase